MRPAHQDSTPDEHEAAITQLVQLPIDALDLVLSLLSPKELVVVGRVSRELRAAAASDAVLRLVFHRLFGPPVDYAFGGVCAPLPWQSWREHVLAFRSTWMSRAKEERGLCLLQINQKIYDATGYVDDHPGMPAFILGAAGSDASEAFALAGHSENARRILRRFAVPHLDAFGFDAPLGSSYTYAPTPMRHQRGARPLKARRRSPRDSDQWTAPSEDAAGDAVVPTPPHDEADEPLSRHAWHRARVLLVHLRSAEGRWRLLRAVGNLFSAALADLDRTAREPVRGSIQRLLPVMWRITCDELERRARHIQL